MNRKKDNIKVTHMKSNDFIENTLIQASNCINGSSFVLHNGFEHPESVAEPIEKTYPYFGCVCV